MQFSALGYMHQDDTLSLPSEILRPIGLGKGKTVYCMYYPKKYSDVPDGDTFNACGFMLTPIPYADWPRTARFTIKLKDIPGAVNSICKSVLSENSSIGFIRGGSTGYSYLTLNITVSFDDLKHSLSNENYNEELGYFEDTFKRASCLSEKILSECQEYLYEGSGSAPLDAGRMLSKKNYQHEPITFSVCTSLTFFWRLTETEKDPSIYPVKLKFGTNNRLIDYKRHIKATLAKVDTEQGNEFSLVGSRTVYASVDTKDQTVRIRILPRENESRVAGVQLDWETTSGGTSRGLLKTFSDYCLQRSWNIRQIHSKESKEKNHSYGRLNLIAEFNSTSEAQSYLSRDVESLRTEFRRVFSEDHEITRARVLELSTVQALAWRKSDVGLNKHRVRFAISAPGSLYDKARKLTKNLNRFGYFAEFIHDSLPKASQPMTPLQGMADVVRRSSCLLVVLDESYGGIETVLKEGVSNPKHRKEGLYSEFEIAMAVGAGIDVIPVAFECEIPTSLPKSSLLSLKTHTFIKLDFKRERESSLSIIEDKYMHYAGLVE